MSYNDFNFIYAYIMSKNYNDNTNNNCITKAEKNTQENIKSLLEYVIGNSEIFLCESKNLQIVQEHGNFFLISSIYYNYYFIISMSLSLSICDIPDIFYILYCHKLLANKLWLD